MTKEEIIIMANRLCEEISKLNFSATYNVNHFYNSISVSVFDEDSNMIVNIQEYFTSTNKKLYRKIEDNLRDFINQHKKVA